MRASTLLSQSTSLHLSSLTSVQTGTSHTYTGLALALMAALTSMSAFAENNPNTPVIPQYPNVKVENQVHAGGKNETVYVEFGSNATTGLVQFEGNTDINVSQNSHGIKIVGVSSKGSSTSGNRAPDLTLEFGSLNQPGGTTNVTVSKDTGILVDSAQSNVSYRGSVNFIVQENSALNVTNNSKGSTDQQTGVTKPIADAIELRVEDTEAGSANDIKVDFAGTGKIETKGGAGFYLLQSGQGNIDMHLSDKVLIDANGKGHAHHHLANHGINAIVQESSSTPETNINKGYINIVSGAQIHVDGDQASGIYARNLSGDINIITTDAKAIHANGNQSNGIEIRASEGSTVVQNAAEIVLNDPNNVNPDYKPTQTTEARGINVFVGELQLLDKTDKYNYKDAYLGNGTGTVLIQNQGQITAHGTDGIGILVNRGGSAQNEQTSRREKPSTAISIANSGHLNLLGNGSAGIVVNNKNASKEGVMIVNSGLLTLRGGSTTGIKVFNAHGDIAIQNTGSIEITKPTTTLKTISNAQQPIDTPAKTLGIHASAADGNVIIKNLNAPNANNVLQISGADSVRGIDGRITGNNGNLTIVNQMNVSLQEGSKNVGIIGTRRTESLNSTNQTLNDGWIQIINDGDLEVSGQKSAGIIGWNDAGSASLKVTGAVHLSNSNDTFGIAAFTQNGHALVMAGKHSDKPEDSLIISGSSLKGIFVHAQGHANEKTLSGKVTVGADAVIENNKNILIKGNQNRGIEAWSEYGTATIMNTGRIVMEKETFADSKKGQGSVGLYAHSDKGDAIVIHKGNILADDLKYGIHAQAGHHASIIVDGSLYVSGSDNFALKAEGDKGNDVKINGDVKGVQAIKMTSHQDAENRILMTGNVTASKGYAVILDTQNDPKASNTGETTVVNTGTLWGQISGKNTAGEQVSEAYENRIATNVINHGTWYVGDSILSEAYGTTVLGTSGQNSVLNRGAIRMNPGLTQAITWNQMGIRTFNNEGMLDLSSNTKAGDWLTITNSTDEATNFKRTHISSKDAAFYKIVDRTHDAKFDGEFISNGGQFNLDINLGDDNTGFADVLIVDNVRLNGRPTILSFTNRRDEIPVDETPLNKGIEVVHVRGTEHNDAGAFVLGTTLTLNGYQYILEQDNEDKNWYIRNYLQDAGGPNTPLIDPNASAYLAGAWLNARVFNHNLYDRRDSSWNKDETVWARIEHNDGEGRFFGDSQQSNLWSNVVQVGREFYKKDNRVAGVFAAYGRTKADNLSPATRTTGRVNSDGYQLGAYWTYLPTYGDGPYLDLWGYWAWFDNKLVGEAVNGRTVKFDSQGFAVSAETGYSWQPNQGRFTIEPHIQVIYSRFEADDANVEGTVYGSGKTKGFQTRVGARFFNDSLTTAEGVKLTPMLEANWLYNGADDTVRAGTTTLESELGRHVGELKLGWQGSMRHNWQSWGHIGMQRGSDHFRNLELQLGVGIKF